MKRLIFQLTIKLDTALSVGAGGSAGTLAAKSIVRDGWGRPIIPGSQVKGKLRWAVEQLLRGMGQDIPTPFEPRERIETNNFVRALFGSPEHRSPLRFADLPTTIVQPQQARALHQSLSQIRPSVSMNRRRGTAEDQRLLFQETALEGMVFHAPNAISGDVREEIDAMQAASLLWAALKLTNRWGGAKSRGLGWATVTCTCSLDGEPISDEALATALCAALTQQGGAQ